MYVKQGSQSEKILQTPTEIKLKDSRVVSTILIRLNLEIASKSSKNSYFRQTNGATVLQSQKEKNSCTAALGMKSIWKEIRISKNKK